MIFFKKIYIIFLFLSVAIHAQIDYSSRWTDYFSYNKVVDFSKVDNQLYAVTENAVFFYNIDSKKVQKFSSVNGLSGERTTKSVFHKSSKKLIVGYENGLFEIISENGNVKKVVDIALTDLSTKRRINDFYIHENKLFIALEFGIVVYDLKVLEFDDTYFIGKNSTDVHVNSILVANNSVYAATQDGVYIASLDSNLNDSNNWIKNFSGDFKNLTAFDERIFVSATNRLYEVVNNNTLVLKKNFPATIIDVSSSAQNIGGATTKQALIYDADFNLVSNIDQNSETFTSISIEDAKLYLGSNESGVLNSTFENPNDFTENYPDGPSSNELFSITISGEDIWCVYGGMSTAYSPLGLKKNVSYFTEGSWRELNYGNYDEVGGVKDIVKVAVDPNNPEFVYLNSIAGKIGDVDADDGGGILVFKNGERYDFWNTVNTNLGSNSGLTNVTLPAFNYTSTNIFGGDFDSKGAYWVINSQCLDGTGALKKRTIDGKWTDHGWEVADIPPGLDNVTGTDFSILKVDHRDNIWVASRARGALVYNQSLDRFQELTSTKGGVPDNQVNAIGVGIDNNIWIGTQKGVVLFTDVDNVFTDNFFDAQPVIIESADGASRLLDGISINDILVDGSGNVWFATDTGGVLQTDSTGKTILNGFNTDNSPLPSNKVLSLGVDNKTGTVYFGTQNGIVSYSSGIVGYGEELDDKIYAFPNPSTSLQEELTIIGKDYNLPAGTNLKILDVAGNLVFESNALDTQNTNGGKFVWNKRNLNGQKVAPGVYIVLLYDAEGKQSGTTKIAIVN